LVWPRKAAGQVIWDPACLVILFHRGELPAARFSACALFLRLRPMPRSAILEQNTRKMFKEVVPPFRIDHQTSNPDKAA
jgi:hypothetical protein